jgi:hypothetical protein
MVTHRVRIAIQRNPEVLFWLKSGYRANALQITYLDKED